MDSATAFRSGHRKIHLLGKSIPRLLAAILALGAAAAPALAGTTPGTAPGQFSVGPTGAATYQISISVPPGVNGLKPSLALLYNSQAGNGLLGQGWSLSGLSVISRCPQTIAQDGAIHMPDLTAKDRFCLDGQRLILTGGSTTYGAAGSIYHTEVDSFQQVTANGTAGTGPASFTVRDRAGLTRQYSKVVLGSDQATPMVWLITRITDAYNNFISFNYNFSGTPYPFFPGVWDQVSEIDYGNNQGTTVGRVLFTYSPTNIRQDKRSQYVAGTLVQLNLDTLTNITVQDGSSNTLRNYTLGYQYIMPTLLKSVQECGSDGSCYSPSTFTYDNGAPAGFNLSGTTTSYLGPNGHTLSSGYQVADLDGDGLMDYVYPSNGQMFVQFGATYQDDSLVTYFGSGGPVLATDSSTGGVGIAGAVPINVFGDGKQELLVPYYPGPNTGSNTPFWQMMLWDPGVGLVMEQAPLQLGTTLSACDPNDPTCTVDAIAVDMGGKGQQGLLFVSSGQLFFYQNINAQFNNHPFPTGIMVGAVNGAVPKMTPINYSGSGEPEIYVAGTGVVTWDPVQQNFVLEAAGNLDDANAKVFFFDADGSGLSSAVVVIGQNWLFYCNTGHGFSFYNPSDSNYTIAPIGINPSEAAPIDWYGDGRQEIMVTADNSGTGGNTFYLFGGDYLGGNWTATNITSSFTLWGLSDLNGDGAADFLFENTGVTPPRTDVYFNQARPYLLTEVADGLGRHTDVGYAPLVVAGHGAYVNACLQNPQSCPMDGTNFSGIQPQEIRDYLPSLYLVDAFAVDSGLFFSSGINAGKPQQLFTYYLYGGSKLDQWGRGFVGFQRVEAINANSGLYTDDTYRQDFPFNGMVQTSTKSSDSSLSNPNSVFLGATGIVTSCVISNNSASCTGPNWPTTLKSFQTGGVTISATADSYQDAYINGSGYAGVYSPYTSSSITTLTDLGSQNPYESITTTSTYSAVGNSTIVGVDVIPTDVKVKTLDLNDSNDTQSIETKTSPSSQSEANCPGHPGAVTVIHSSPALPTGLTQTENFTYDGNCFLTKDVKNIIDPAGSSRYPMTLTKAFTPDGYGNPLQSSVSGSYVSGDSNGSRVTTMTYDSTERFPATIANPLNQTESLTYDAWGNKLTDTDANSNTVTYTYDGFERKTKQSGPLLKLNTTWVYGGCTSNCASGVVYQVSQNGSDGSSATSQYDELGRAVHASHLGFAPNEIINQDTVYDLLGRVVQASAPYKAGDTACWDVKGYDVLNRVTTEYQPINSGQCSNSAGATTGSPERTISTSYDGLMTTRTVSDPSGDTPVANEKTITTLNVLGKPASVKDYAGQSGAQVETDYDYDVWGNLTSVSPPPAQPGGTSAKVSMSYDSIGDKLSMQDPDMGSWSYTYDALGELLTQTDANGNTVANQYDWLGRLFDRKEAEGETRWVYDIGYGAGIGKLAYTVGPLDSNGALQTNGAWEGYAYDAFGETTDKITVVGGQEYWVTNTYDGQGRVSQVVYPNMTAVNVSGTPSVPAGLTVAVDQNNGAAYDLAWQINSAQNGQIFHLYRTLSTATQPGDADEIYSGPVPNWQDTTITTDNTYVWWLKACNDTVCSGLISSAPVNVTLPPTAPGAPQYLGDSHQRNITLTWLASTSRGGTTGAITYNVSAIFTPWGATTPTSTTVVAPGVADTGTQYASTTVPLSQDGTYAFSVRACQGPEPCSAADGGFMTYTTVLQPSLPGVPNPPTTVTPTTVPASIPFSWAASSFTGGPVIYEVQAKNSIGNNQFADIGPQPGSATSVTDIQNTDGVFLYQVQACDTNETPHVCSGYVQAAASTAVTLPPVKVTAPIVPPSDLNSYRWNIAYSPTATLATSSTGTISYYIVQYLSGVSGYTLVPGPDAPSGGQNWRTATAVSQGGYYQNGTYSYAIHACTTDPAVGSAMACSPWVNSGNYTTVIAPGVPTSINAPAQSNWDGTYTVTYSPPATNTGGIATNYSLQVYDVSCEQGGTNCVTVIDGRCSSTTTSCTFPGNSNTGDFSLQIEALDSGIASAWLQAGGITVGKTTVTGLSTNPAGLSYTGGFTLNWTAVTGASSYQIYQSANGGAYSLKATSGTNSYSPSGLAAGSYAYYVVPCSSTYGCGVASAAVSETVQLLPGVPTNIGVSPNPSTGSYQLYWNAAPGVVSYYIVNGNTTNQYTTLFVDYTKNRGGSFSYYVQACNSHGCGAQSGTVTETVNLAGCPPYPQQCQFVLSDDYLTSTSGPAEAAGHLHNPIPSPAAKSASAMTAMRVQERRTTALPDLIEAGAVSVTSGYAVVAAKPAPAAALSETRISAPALKLPVLSALAMDTGVHPASNRLSRLDLPQRPAANRVQRVARLNHGRAHAPRLLAAANLSPRQAYFLAHAGRTTAPKLKHLRRARPTPQEPVVATARYAPPIDPILSLYPPLRSDIRVLAHFVARGGNAPAQVHNASLSVDCRDSDNDVECTTPDSPNALMVGYVYNSHGYLQKVEKLNASGTAIAELWQATDETAIGQVDQQVFDAAEGSTSGAFSVNDTYDTASGLLVTTAATAANTTGGVTHLTACYTWDGYDNLLARQLAEISALCPMTSAALNESFAYDAVNRMTQVTDSASNVTHMQYDDVGGFKYNGAYTGYVYGSPDSTACNAYPFGPAHAVSSLVANGTTPTTRYFCYDANGNLTKETGDVTHTLTWASYNKPTSITSGSTTETFIYSPSRERLQTTVTGSSGSVTTTYIDGLFEQVQDSAGNITYKHYIIAGSARVGVETVAVTSSGTTDNLSFFVQDQVGSVVAEVTEGLGGLNQQLTVYSHDAWGKARPTSGTGANLALPPGTFLPDSAVMAGQHEGFAGHEDLEDIGIVDMEGRVYDPETGRFLSPDPNVQFPDSSQGYNRYSYVNNNPLSLSDPSGYFAGNSMLGVAAMIAVDYVCEGACGAWTPFLSGAAEGYVSSGGDLQQAAISGAVAMEFAAAGGAYGENIGGAQLFARSVTEGLIGGMFSQAGGGHFSDGFVGAFAGSESSELIGKIGGERTGQEYFSPANESARVAVSAIVGGTASRLTGGRFTDGAVAAAFQRLFNDDHAKPDISTDSDNEYSETVYGETGGIYPELKPVVNGTSAYTAADNPKNWDPGSAADLKTAREWVARVREVNKVTVQDIPNDTTNKIQLGAWKDAVAAANARDSIVLPGGTKFFFIRQVGSGPQGPTLKQWGSVQLVKSFGPFINQGGGDVPKGVNTYIDFYKSNP